MMIVTGISGSHVVMNFGERSQDPEATAHIHALDRDDRRAASQLGGVCVI
jgi:hypothetical protein